MKTPTYFCSLHHAISIAFVQVLLYTLVSSQQSDRLFFLSPPRRGNVRSFRLLIGVLLFLSHTHTSFFCLERIPLEFEPAPLQKEATSPQPTSSPFLPHLKIKTSKEFDIKETLLSLPVFVGVPKMTSFVTTHHQPIQLFISSSNTSITFKSHLPWQLRLQFQRPSSSVVNTKFSSVCLVKSRSRCQVVRTKIIMITSSQENNIHHTVYVYQYPQALWDSSYVPQYNQIISPLAATSKDGKTLQRLKLLCLVQK